MRKVIVREVTNFDNNGRNAEDSLGNYIVGIGNNKLIVVKMTVWENGYLLVLCWQVYRMIN